MINLENAKIIEFDSNTSENTDSDKELISFVLDHTDRWRDYRNQNYLSDWERYERIFRGKWAESDKNRDSERARIISPATQQAIETRHAEIMEAIFGQNEYFDIKDDILDPQKYDISEIKRRLKEDFEQDKIKKSIDSIVLMAEIYGTGIGEIMVGEEIYSTPDVRPINSQVSAYGVTDKPRVYVRLNPVNPKNFLFDPNGTSIDDCMGIAVERFTSIHKIMDGVSSGKYRDVKISELYDDKVTEPTQETTIFRDQKVTLLTYYGLVPYHCLKMANSGIDSGEYEDDDYKDMVEAIIIICNGKLLKAEENPYMMKDRPVVLYQADTVPNRLLGRGSSEKALNMQVAIDSQMRAHLDSLALTSAPMVGLDATRLPRGAKFEIKPGKAFMTNGTPGDIIYPFKFGETDGSNLQTSKEFERMLLMATGTLDSQGMVNSAVRDASGLAPAVAGIIKKYKRTLINFQEDFLIPFIRKSIWRYMQFSPERYPPGDYKFMPTGSLGIIAREYEQQQLAFMIQTLGENSPITPILMEGMLENSSFHNRDEMIQRLKQAMQPDPAQQQMAQQKAMKEIQLVDAQIIKEQALAKKASIEADLAPKEIMAEIDKIAAQMSLEKMKAEHQFRQEELRSTNDITIDLNRSKVGMEADKYKADVKAQTDLILEQAKRETQIELEKIRAEKEFILAEVNKKPVEPFDVNSLVQQIASVVSEQINAPKTIERDENGFAISVNGRPITRGPDGQIIGIQ